jgi:hypothetical protein
MPIRLQDIAERLGQIDFTYYGDDVHILYRVERITKEFRAMTLRMSREGMRMQKRGEAIANRVMQITAEEGTPEMDAENQAAEADIAQLKRDDDDLKHQIDAIVCEVVAEWDLLGADGKPLPLTPENVFIVPADFERAVLTAVLEAASVGESNSQPSKKPLQLTSKQKGKQAI